jgi:hypothetical protein
VLYELLTGRTPYTGVNIMALVSRIATRDPEPPSALAPGLPASLDAVVLRALARDPEGRFQTAAELARALDEVSREAPGAAETAPVLTRPARTRASGGLAPLIGREQELEALRERLEMAAGGECHLVLISGEAGIGKTRLVEEIERAALESGIEVLHGRCIEMNQAFPYNAYSEVIQEHLRRRPGAAAKMRGVARELVALFPILAEVEPFRGVAAAAGGRDERGEDQTSVFETLASALALIAGGKPLVICLDDLHLADVSIEALQYIVRRLMPAPLLILGMYRPAEVNRRHPIARLLAAFRGARRFAHVQLGPLSAALRRNSSTTTRLGT